MEHMGIEFAVRARLGRNNWALTILPKNRGPITLDFTGTRDQAISAAHRRITGLTRPSLLNRARPWPHPKARPHR
jgi:hypothetical protein